MQNVSKTENPANANDGHRCCKMHPALNKTEKPPPAQQIWKIYSNVREDTWCQLICVWWETLDELDPFDSSRSREVSFAANGGFKVPIGSIYFGKSILEQKRAKRQQIFCDKLLLRYSWTKQQLLSWQVSCLDLGNSHPPLSRTLQEELCKKVSSAKTLHIN